jgi:hypothetical protein
MFLLIHGIYYGTWGATDLADGCGEHRSLEA